MAQRPGGIRLVDWVKSLPAVAICVVFFIVISIRFGDPMRQAERAAHAMETTIPERVQAVVAEEVGDLNDIPFRFELLRQKVAEIADGGVESDQLDASIAAVRGEIAALRADVQALRSEIRVNAAARATTMAAAAAAPQNPTTTTPQGSPTPAQLPVAAASEIQPVALQPPAAALTQRRNGYSLSIVEHALTADGFYFDLSLTKETEGDGEVLIAAPSPNDKARIVLADGRLIFREGGRAGVLGDRGFRGRVSLTAPARLPARVFVGFDANIDKTVLCRRVDFHLRLDGDWTLFTFENLVVSPRQ